MPDVRWVNSLTTDELAFVRGLLDIMLAESFPLVWAIERRLDVIAELQRRDAGISSRESDGAGRAGR